MRDSHAAMPVERPTETPGASPRSVLPYDPEDWDRRLAEARQRREAVLRQRAASAATPATDRPSAPLAHVAPAAGVGGRAARTKSPDPAEWQRRLAEARGLIPSPDGRTGPRGASDRPAWHLDEAARAAAPLHTVAVAAGTGMTGGNADRSAPPASCGAPMPAAATEVDPAPAATAMWPAGSTGACGMDGVTGRPKTRPVDPQKTPPGPARAASRRPVLFAGLGGLGGLAAGVALAMVLVPGGKPAPTGTVVAAINPTRSEAHFAVPADLLPLAPPAWAPSGLALAGPVAARTHLPVLPVHGARPAALDTPAPARMTPPSMPDLPSVPAVSAPLQPLAFDAVFAPSSETVGALESRDTGDVGATMPSTTVVVHVPVQPDAAMAGSVLAVAQAEAWATVSIDFTVTRSHLRVYHDGDRAAAVMLGDRLGLPVRDFTTFGPAPRGLIEIWVAGGPISDG